MTLRLILTRHAKSDWDDPLLDDHDRHLNARGCASAVAIGAWLAARGYIPDLVLSSDAVRTRETWALMAPALNDAACAVWTRTLYLAGPAAMLKALRGASDASTVMMLGHNPGIADFAASLVQTPPAHRRFADYPTGATLVADFAADSWDRIGPAEGKVVDFVVPRDLE